MYRSKNRRHNYVFLIRSAYESESTKMVILDLIYHWILKDITLVVLYLTYNALERLDQGHVYNNHLEDMSCTWLLSIIYRNSPKGLQMARSDIWSPWMSWMEVQLSTWVYIGLSPDHPRVYHKWGWNELLCHWHSGVVMNLSNGRILATCKFLTVYPVASTKSIIPFSLIITVTSSVHGLSSFPRDMLASPLICLYKGGPPPYNIIIGRKKRLFTC